MRGESYHSLCLEYLVLFIACNDNPAKFVGRRAHQIGKHSGIQHPCSGDCSPPQEEALYACSGHPSAVLGGMRFREISTRETDPSFVGQTSQCENSLLSDTLIFALAERDTGGEKRT